MSQSFKKAPLSAQIDLSKFSQMDFTKATEDEKRQQDVMGESTTFFKDGMRRLRRNPLAMGSIVVLILIILVICIAPMVVPYGYAQIVKGAGNLSPSSTATRSSPPSRPVRASSPTSSAPTPWAGITSSALSTARG